MAVRTKGMHVNGFARFFVPPSGLPALSFTGSPAVTHPDVAGAYLSPEDAMYDSATMGDDYPAGPKPITSNYSPDVQVANATETYYAFVQIPMPTLWVDTTLPE